MCGIVGYTGDENAAPILLAGLTKLEYRGYDSAGIAVRDLSREDTAVVRSPGRLINLIQKTDNGASVPGTCGLGHTRWATHGEPTEVNAHPHSSLGDDVVGVHNGIIENYRELKDKLIRKGYVFRSETDTEVAVNLVDYYYKKYRIGPIDAIAKAMVRIRGSYALALMFRDLPGEIWVARKDSPMIIGVTEKSAFVASDVPAILSYTRSVYYIDNLEMARLAPGQVTFFNLDGDEVEKKLTEITWDAEAAEKGGFAHFMLKEIHEQPKAVRDTLGNYLTDTGVSLAAAGLTDEALRSFQKLCIVGCGSAYHVAVSAKYVLEDMADVEVDVDLASEFRYRGPRLTPKTLVVVISQSGETADTLAALRLAKEKGAPTLAIVNVVGSSIARECDHCMYTYAGPEIAVATTKAYSAQLVNIYILAVRMGLARGVMDEAACAAYIAELRALPEKMERTLENKERIQWFASKFVNARDIFFIGRGADYAVSMEGSLKLKEISYIHSEAYAAGELKHGTISLVENGTLVIGVLTKQELLEKTLSNMAECKARGAYLMGLTSYGNYFVEDTVNFTIYVPKTDPHFIGSLAIIPLQLLGYYTGVARGVDVDKPRNLAKSVTVE